MRTQSRTRADRQRWLAHLRRPAFTLIELLVVIGILLILLAIALPVIGLGVDDRRIREASRGVNAFLAAARDKAISTGRPYGVQFIRFNAAASVAGGGAPDQRTLNTCMAMAYVEVPPPYGGDSLYSRMVVSINGSNQSYISYVGQIDASGNPVSPDTYWSTLVKYGDRVQLGYQGHMFTIKDSTGNTPDSYVTNPVGCILYSETATWSAATSNIGTPYQVFRAPVKSGAATYQLPEGAVIDLSSSGAASNEFMSSGNNNDMNPVTIMFAPSGGIERVYFGQNGNASLSLGGQPTGAIFLLVGEPQKVLAPMGVSNYQVLTNLWVSINSRTGLIQSNQMAMDPSNGSGYPLDVYEGRTYAREKQGMGGR